MSWPRAVGQAPLFFGQRPTGRPANPDDYYTSKYQDVSNDPLYPFGHGLSYGRFSYSNLRVPADAVSEADTHEVRVDIPNARAKRQSAVWGKRVVDKVNL